MKLQNKYLCVLMSMAAGLAGCTTQSDECPPRRVTVVERPSDRPAHPNIDYTQKAESSKVLISEARAKKFIEDFGRLYFEKGKPPSTFSIRVNPGPDGKDVSANQLANQQAIADYIRFFGRPLRDGGIKLVDEEAARQIKPDFRPDILLKVYASVRTFSIPGFDGESIMKSVPDVQVTAVQLSDGAIVGQASTVDLIGDRADAWVVVQRVGAPEVLKATALVLLEDMVLRGMERRRGELLKLIGDVSPPLSPPVVNVPPPPASGTAPSTPVVQVPPPPTSDTPPSAPAANLPHPASPSELRRGPLTEIEPRKVSLINNISKQERKKMEQEVTAFNNQCKEVEAWQLGLLREDQVSQKKDPQLVKNTITEKLKVH